MPIQSLTQKSKIFAKNLCWRFRATFWDFSESASFDICYTRNLIYVNWGMKSLFSIAMCIVTQVQIKVMCKVRLVIGRFGYILIVPSPLVYLQ